MTVYKAELEDTSSGRVAGEDASVNEMEDSDKAEKDETALQDKGADHREEEI